ncbi:MAG: hypothetical protein HKN91_11130 [Acidimicrobiia bacterium]|nr:hypothetical protein [Acidimicrobiia bacterium]
MKRFLTALAAAGVLVAGGFIAAAVSTPSTATAQETTEAPVDESTAERPDRGAIMDEVFADLVADGVLTEEQADQVQAALEAKRDELREQIGDRLQRRDHRNRLGGFLQGALEDGVVDADELAQLPAGHPFSDPDGPLAEYLADGQLTDDELTEIREQFRQNRGPRGFGAGQSEDAAA